MPVPWLGAPLLEELLGSALRNARCCRAWITGLGTRPPQQPEKLLRRLELPAGARIVIRSMRAIEVSILVHWFRADYVSDEKEQATFTVAIEGSEGRQVRHLERLLDWSRLQDAPLEAMPEAPQMPRAEIYRIVRERVARTVSATANTRRRELLARYERHEARMRGYYAALRAEIDQQVERALKRSEDAGRARARRAAAEREQERRLAELGRTCSLRVRLSLTNLLEVRQPKLLIGSELSVRVTPRAARLVVGRVSAPAPGPPPPGTPLRLVWDPLTETLEPPACPSCGHPTFAPCVVPGRPEWSCPGCAGGP